MTWEEKMVEDRSVGCCVVSRPGGGRGSFEDHLEVMSKRKKAKLLEEVVRFSQGTWKPKGGNNGQLLGRTEPSGQ